MGVHPELFFINYSITSSEVRRLAAAFLGARALEN